MTMKVLFFLQSLDVGGIETVFLRILNGIDLSKYDVEVKFLYNYGRLLKDIPKGIKWSYIFDEKWFIRGYTHFYKLFPVKWITKKAFRGEYDVIVSYGEGPITSVLAAYEGQAKTISWLHRVYDKTEMKVLCGSLSKAKKLYNSFDKVICVSTDVERSLRESVPDLKKTEVVINPIDTENIKNRMQEKVDDICFDSNCLNFITVGRYAHQKGFVRLINIFSKLIKEGKKNIKLYIIGSGNEEKQYKKMINNYELQQNVFIVGYRENPIKYMSKADVYVCSSYWEGFSTSVMEALLANMLIITTDCGGMKDILGFNNEYGIVVNNTDNDLYEGLKYIIDTPQIIEEYREKASVRAKEFDYEDLVKKIMESIEKEIAYE